MNPYGTVLNVSMRVNEAMEKKKPIKMQNSSRLVLPALVLARFATQPSGLITGLLLIEIGNTFGTQVGVTGQIRAISSTIALIFALLIGMLSVRFKNKSLLMIGLLCYVVSALGCSVAPNFNMMILTFSVSGIGMATVRPMASALAGEHIPLERRAKAVGWILAGGSISYLVGAPVISYIAGIGDWRMTFLGFMFPVSLLTMVVAYVGIPSRHEKRGVETGDWELLEGFKRVFSNLSAVACLLGASLGMATWTATLTYSVSFFRQRFLISTGWASLIISGLALCFTLGSLSSGYLINFFGRKRFTVISTFLLGVFTIVYLNLGVLWMSLVLAFISCILAGMRYSASDNLTLEQLPEFRGTLMSISSAASSLGSTLGAGIGGLVLTLGDYGSLGISLGSFGMIAAVVYLLLAIDPTVEHKI